jgi:ACS family hexuronate transporter-like MFS transporter
MRFSTREYSYVVGAFQLAYTIMQPVCGYVLDLFGTRTGFALFALMWSLVSCLHGFATGWLSLAFFRGWLGLTEAAAIPAAVKAISEWFPAKERSAVAIGGGRKRCSERIPRQRLRYRCDPVLGANAQVRFGL